MPLRLSLLLFLSCFALSVQSQNWSVFPPNTSKLYFEDTTGFLYALKIDTSYNTGNQRTIELVPTLEFFWRILPNCEGTIAGGIVTGKTIVETGSVIEFHFSAGIVPLPLKANSQSFNFEGQTLTMNRISKRDTLLAGVSDTIMEFKVTTTASIFGVCFDYGSIILSKNNGLLTSIGCFSLAPTWSDGIQYMVGPLFKSIPKMQSSKIWDFNVGDQFHFIDEYSSGRFDSHTFSNYEIKSKTVTATDYVYTVDFVIERNPKPDTAGTTTWVRPIQFVIEDSVTFRMTNPVAGSRNTYYKWRNNWKNTQKPYYRKVKGVPGLAVDSCLSYGMLEFTIETIEYVEGLGKVLDYASGHDSGNSFAYGERLYFYKKGTETWGHPYYIGLKEEAVLEQPIYPNPTAHVLNIENLENTTTTTWHISTAAGQKIAEGSLSPNQTKIEVGYLPKGIYFLALQNGGTFRFIKN